MSIFDKDIKLPQVKKVNLEIIPPFDYKLLSHYLNGYKELDIAEVNWPEAIKAMYRNTLKAEIEIMHIKSCCDVALNKLKPLKKSLWNNIIKHSVIKEV